jgi:hypothetical protein
MIHKMHQYHLATMIRRVRVFLDLNQFEFGGAETVARNEKRPAANRWTVAHSTQ